MATAFYMDRNFRDLRPQLAGLRVTLISGRSLGQARGKVAGKFSEEYQHNVAICEFNPDDLKSLGIEAGQNVRLTTRNGSVVLKATVASQQVQRGIVFAPYGPWINSIIPSETSGTGMPSFKGIEVEVMAAPNDRIVDLESLVGQIGMDGKIGQRS
jgi:formylmethanofuran dehydrogenase subunit D